jgi:hypothetical protein
LRSDIAGLVETEIKTTDKRLYKSDNHYQDWIDAIKKRTRPVSDVETGHRTASLCNIANIAYTLQRPLKWDPKKEQFVGDAAANMMLSRAYRGKWNFLDF